VSYVEERRHAAHSRRGQLELNLSEDEHVGIHVKGRHVETRPELVRDPQELEQRLRSLQLKII
jgi:hypothetical protein